MAQRLVETYRIGDSVEVFFQDEVAEEWRPARVVALQHPGLWVITEDRRLWFVTNGKRIRRTSSLSSTSTSTCNLGLTPAPHPGSS